MGPIKIDIVSKRLSENEARSFQKVEDGNTVQGYHIEV